MEECDYCGREREDVERCPDPYARRVHMQALWVSICLPCRQGRNREATEELGHN